MAQERERRELERKRDYRLQVQQRNLGVRVCALGRVDCVHCCVYDVGVRAWVDNVCRGGGMGLYATFRCVAVRPVLTPVLSSPQYIHHHPQKSTGARYGHHPPGRAQ